MDPDTLALLGLGALGGSVVQGATGFGFAIVAAPLFLIAMNSHAALQVLVVDSRGRPVRGIVSLQIIDSVRIRNDAGRIVTRRIRMREQGVGRILINGLPTGKAKITARRANGARSRAVIVPVLPDRTRRVQIRIP